MNEQMKIKVTCPIAGEVWWDLLRIGVENKLINKFGAGWTLDDDYKEVTFLADGGNYGCSDVWFYFVEDEDLHQHLVAEFGQHLSSVPYGCLEADTEIEFSSNDIYEWVTENNGIRLIRDYVRELLSENKKRADLFWDYIRTYQHNEDGSWSDGRDWNEVLEDYLWDNLSWACEQMSLTCYNKTTDGIWGEPTFLTECGVEDYLAAEDQVSSDIALLIYNEAVDWMRSIISSKEGK